MYAIINGACILPATYFFFPETAYRSLEEMDEIFHKSTNYFDVVKISLEMPHRYGKKGELLIAYEDTEFASVMRPSIASQHSNKGVDADAMYVEHKKG